MQRVQLNDKAIYIMRNCAHCKNAQSIARIIMCLVSLLSSFFVQTYHIGRNAVGQELVEHFPGFEELLGGLFLGDFFRQRLDVDLPVRHLQRLLLGERVRLYFGGLEHQERAPQVAATGLFVCVCTSRTKEKKMRKRRQKNKLHASKLNTFCMEE